MAYTAADLYKNGLARFGMNFSDGLLGNDNATGVYAVLAGGIIEFNNARDWNYLLSYGNDTVYGDLETTSGTWVTLPTDFGKMYAVGLYDPISELTAISPDADYRLGYAFQNPTNAQRGIPRFYTVVSGTMIVYPAPVNDTPISYMYYRRLDTEQYNTTDLSSTTPLTSLAGITVTNDFPPEYRALAELYVAKNAALLIKDREVYSIIQDEIRTQHAVLDDNIRKTQATQGPRTRADWTL